MVVNFVPFKFEIDTALIAGACLWALALYLGLSSFREWVIEAFNKWFNFAEKFMYLSEEEFEKTRQARESQNSFYASLFSVIPFFILGALCNWGIEVSLGLSWSISFGILSCIACGVYELGRFDSQNNS